MPVIVGPSEILNVNGGIVQFGDSAFITPKLGSKTFGGAGGFNTGGVIVANNGLSGTNVTNTNATDQPIVENN